MNVPVTESMLKRLKIIRRLIKKGNESKKFKQKHKSLKDIAAALIREGISRWEFIHDDYQRKENAMIRLRNEKRKSKKYTDGERLKKKKKKLRKD